MEGVRLGKSELTRKFGIDERFAVRIGALLAKRVQLTAPLITAAAENRDLESFLCGGEFFEKADSVTTRTLKQMLDKAGVKLDSPLIVRVEEGWRIIGLEEEVLAEEGWQAAARGEAGLTVRRKRGIAPRPRFGIFEEDEEIAGLKLTAMTSSDAGERAAAVRQLIYSSIPPEQRASIFFEILVDPISRGRAEAIAGLEALGFSRDAGDALRDLFTGKTEEQEIAIERLGVLLKRLDEAQSVVIIGAMLQMLESCDSISLQKKILGALRETAATVVRNADYAEELIKFCSKAVQADRAQMAASARGILLDMARADVELIRNLVWDELQTVSNSSARMFLMCFLAQIGAGEGRSSELAQLMARELLAEGASESERLLLGHAMVDLGEVSVSPLLDVLEKGDTRNAAFVVPFLDTIAVEGNVSKAARNRIAQRFLQSLKVKERRVRMAILQARLCYHEDLTAKLRQALAAEFVENAQDFLFPDTADQIDSSLEAMGKDAIEPLFDYVKRHPHDELSDRFIRVIGRVIERISEEGKRLPARTKEIMRFCIARMDDERVKSGGYVAALGMIASGPAGSRDFCEKLISAMINGMWKVAYTVDFFDALGRLAASKHVSADRQSGLTALFLRILRGKRPDTLAKERRTEDGLVYEFGRESDIETVLLPASVEALGRICLSPHCSEELRDRIVTTLLSAWDEASSWRVIWGPFSSETLARTLGKIASSELIPIEVKLKIGKAMNPYIGERLSVVRAMGEICSQNFSSSELDKLALAAIEGIIDGWLVPESDEEERAIALKALADIAAREKFNPRSRKVREARDRVIELLFEGLRTNIDGCLDSLQKLRDCQGLTKTQRKLIEDRLKAATQLARIS